MKGLSTLLVAVAMTITVHAQPPFVPLNGLVAWYGFNGNAVDESGQGHNGTPNSPTLANDRCGAADGSYYFDGDDHIELADTDTHGTTAFSVSAWARFSGISSPLAVISKHVNFSQNGCGPWQVGSALQYGDSAWHLLTGTFNGDSMVLYVDTIAVASMGGVPPPNANGMNVRVGMDSDLAAFVGGIDEVGLWSRALTEAEVAQLYEACSTVSMAELLPDGSVQVFPSAVRAGGPVQIIGPVGTTLPYAVIDADGRVVGNGQLVNGRAFVTLDRIGVHLVHVQGAASVRIVVH